VIGRKNGKLKNFGLGGGGKRPSVKTSLTKGVHLELSTKGGEKKKMVLHLGGGVVGKDKSQEKEREEIRRVFG